MDLNRSGSGRVDQLESGSDPAQLENLELRSVRGGFWIVLLQGVNRSMHLVRMVILAKLLAPEDFGMFGVALIALSVLTLLSQTGFSFALIQKQKDPLPYLDTVWSVGVVRGFAIAGILYIAAPLIEQFFEIPGSGILIQVIGFSFALSSLGNSGIVLFEKDLNYSRQFIYTGSGTFFGVAVAILFAFWWRNAWALVAGAVASDMVKVLMSYWLHPYRPTFRLEYQKLRELFSFGKWITGVHILYFIGRNGVNILVGKMLGATALGLYQLSFRVAFIPSTELAVVANRVSFPTLSLLQDLGRRYRKAFFRTVRMVAVCILPAASVTFCLAPDLVEMFLDSRWLPTVDLIRILALAAPFQAISYAGETLFSSYGVPRYIFFSWLIRTLLLVGISFPLILNFGLQGAVWAIAADALTGFGLWLIFSGKVLKNPWGDFWDNLAPSLLTLALVMIPWLLVREMIQTDSLTIFWRLAYLGTGGLWLLGGYLFGLRTIRILFKNFDIYEEFRQVFENVRRPTSS